MLQLNAVKDVKIGSKRRGDKKLPVEFISVYGSLPTFVDIEGAEVTGSSKVCFENTKKRSCLHSKAVKIWGKVRFKTG